MGTRQWSYILVYEYESIGGCDRIDLTVGVTLEKKSCDDVSPLVAGLSDLFSEIFEKLSWFMLTLGRHAYTTIFWVMLVLCARVYIQVHGKFDSMCFIFH